MKPVLYGTKLAIMSRVTMRDSLCRWKGTIIAIRRNHIRVRWDNGLTWWHEKRTLELLPPWQR